MIEAPSSGTEGTTPQTILIVEDEALIALAEKADLEQFGYRVGTAVSGEQALERVASEQIDLILMDIDLGPSAMDGTETARRILAGRDIPIVFLSSHTEPEYVARTEDVTSYGYVVKGTATTALVASIKMAFRLFAMRRSLAESEDKYRAAFMTSPDSININRLDGLYVDINQGFTDLTGYTRDDVMGKLSSEIDIWAIPEDRARLVEGLRNDGAVSNLQSEFRCKDGTVKTALMSARLIEIEGQPHILSVTRDITWHISAERELQSRERRYTAIFEEAAEGILMGAADGTITDANRSMCDLTGYSREELLGNTIEMLFEPHVLEQQPLQYGKVVSGSAVRRERILKAKTGSRVHVVMNTKQIEPNCLQAIFHDVSELRAAE